MSCLRSQMGLAIRWFGPSQGEIANNQEPREWFARGALRACPPREIKVQIQSA